MTFVAIFYFDIVAISGSVKHRYGSVGHREGEYYRNLHKKSRQVDGWHENTAQLSLS